MQYTSLFLILSNNYKRKALVLPLKDIDYKRKFEDIFKSMFPTLCLFAQKYVSDMDSSKEIVHKVFIALWEKRGDIDFEKPMKSYLFTSVHNRCLNYIRDNKKFSNDELTVEALENQLGADSADNITSAETVAEINEAIQSLPEKCREIFILNRFEGLKYQEIADKLGISVKTVEAQMSKALKILREKLEKYLKLMILWWLMMMN